MFDLLDNKYLIRKSFGREVAFAYHKIDKSSNLAALSMSGLFSIKHVYLIIKNKRFRLKTLSPHQVIASTKYKTKINDTKSNTVLK